MRLRFDAFSGGDDDAFASAKDRLLDEFKGWLDERGDRDDGTTVANASMFLDWRYSYSTGELDDYRDGELAEFLLEWCPRKYSAPAEEALNVCRSVGRLIEFLARTHRLVGGADRAARLITLANDLAPEAYRAMGDPSNFGMAKSLFGGALADVDGDGDIDDIDDLQALLDAKMAEFNALPLDQRKALTDQFFAGPEPDSFELPFLHTPPPEHEVVAAAVGAPIITKLDALRHYLGVDGKTLTAKGNLKLADGRALAELLDTGDQFDPVIRGRTFKTRSTEQLRRLAFIVGLAERVGAVRVAKGRLVPVAAWDERSPVDQAASLVDAVVDEGPLSMLFDGGYRGRDPIVASVDGGLVHWLTLLLPPDAEVPFDEVVGFGQAAVRQQVTPSRYWPADEIDRSVARDLARTTEVMELLNVLRWRGASTTATDYGTTERHGGTLALTALGHHVLPELAAAVGYVIPSTADLADVDADELLDAAGDLDADRFEAAVAAWRTDLQPTDRAAALAAAVGAATRGHDRLAGLAALDLLGTEVAEPFVRQLLDSPAAAHAASWLLAHDLADEETVGGFIGIGLMVDILASSLDDPEELCALFLESPTSADADAALQQMWRHDAPETAEVLEALGEHLPDRRLAKAARKALFQHRSWMANRG